MRQGQSLKRPRNQRRKQGGNVNRAMESTGPDVKIRGTANQIHEKYLQLSRDAQSSGDRIKAENFLQHAEHYFRILRAMQPGYNAQPQPGMEGEGRPNETTNGAQPEIAASGEAPREEKPGAEDPKPIETSESAAAAPVENGAGVNGGEEAAEPAPKPRRGRRRRPPAASAENAAGEAPAKKGANGANGANGEASPEISGDSDSPGALN